MLLPLGARADLTEEGGVGLSMLMLYPFVLGLFTLVAPRGKRLLTLGVTFIALPWLAALTYGFAKGNPGSAQRWFSWTALPVAVLLGLLLLTKVVGVIRQVRTSSATGLPHKHRLALVSPEVAARNFHRGAQSILAHAPAFAGLPVTRSLDDWFDVHLRDNLAVIGQRRGASAYTVKLKEQMELAFEHYEAGDTERGQAAMRTLLELIHMHLKLPDPR